MFTRVVILGIPSAEQPAQVTNIVDILPDATTACEYSGENFNQLATLRNVNGLWCMFQLMYSRNDAVGIKVIDQMRHLMSIRRRVYGAIFLFCAVFWHLVDIHSHILA